MILKHKKRSLCTASVLALFISSSFAAEINNAGFESGFNGWNDTDPSSISSVTYSGNRSAKISGSSGRVEQTVNVEQNSRYILSAWIRGKGRLGVNVDGSNKTTKASTSDWRQYEVEFDTGNASSVKIYGKWGDGQGRFDDFSLVKVNTSPDPQPDPTPDPVSCSGTQNINIQVASDNGSNDGNGPQNAIDGSLSSRWSSFGIGKTITFDLGLVASVDDVQLAFFKGNQRRAFFSIEASVDNANWTQILGPNQSNGQSNALQTFNVNDIDARYVRVIGNGNTSNNWNSITEAKVLGCTEGNSDGGNGGGDNGGGDSGSGNNGGGETGTNLDPNLPPSGNFDLLDWTISVPIDDNSDGKADTIKEVPLSSGYELRPYFYTADDGGMVFRSNVKGAKTSTNTKFTRSELREMLRRGNTDFSTKGVGKNNWVFGSAPSSDRNAAGGVNGVLTATLEVNHVTTTGDSSQVGRVIIGQIHANDDEPLRLYYRKLPNNIKGAIYFAHEPNGGSDRYVEIIGSRSSSASNPSDGIALNERFSYKVEVVGSQLTVTIMRPGKPDETGTYNMSNSGYSSGGQYMYFKAGVYNQNNSGNDSDYVQATFYALDNTHNGYNP